MDKLNPVMVLNPDFFFGIGSAKIRSTGHFYAHRDGHMIHVTGIVVHKLVDERYDFNDDQNLDRNIFTSERLLSEKNYAKPFAIEWQKIQNYTASFLVYKKPLFRTHNEWSDHK